MHALVTLLLFSFVNTAFADDGPLDDLGCHVNEAQTNYHCHAGPLAGARYPDRPAAERAMSSRTLASATDDEASDVPTDVVHLVSWTFGGTTPDAERLASVIGKADLVVLRGLGPGTEAFANKVGNSIDARLQKKICRGYRAGEVYLWRDQTLAFARKDGTLGESCGARAHDVGPGQTTVYQLRRGKRLFTFGASGFAWPTLVVAETFAAAAKQNYQIGLKHAPESLWTRDAYVLDAHTINLRHAFPDLKAKEIERRFGRATPLEAHVTFTEPTRETIQFVKKDARPRPAAVSIAPTPTEPDFETYPSLDSKELSKVEDDLDGEESAARVSPPPSARKRRKHK